MNELITNSFKTVSVIIPVYNAEKTIFRCLESLVKQTYQDIEIIVIDDGSKDNTNTEIVKLGNFSNIKVIHQNNCGVDKARNVGIDYATGTYIMFCDSDDYLNSNAIEQLLYKANQEKADIVIGGHYLERYCKDDLISWDVHTHCKNWSFDTSNLSLYFSELMKIDEYFCGTVWGKLFLRSIIEENNLIFLDEPCYEDAVFLWNYLLFSKRIAFVNEPLYHYCVQTELGSALSRRKRVDLYHGILSYEKMFHTFCTMKSVSSEFNRQMYSYFRNTLFVLLKKLIMDIKHPLLPNNAVDEHLLILMKEESFIRIINKNDQSYVCSLMKNLIIRKRYFACSILIKYKVGKAK